MGVKNARASGYDSFRWTTGQKVGQSVLYMPSLSGFETRVNAHEMP